MTRRRLGLSPAIGACILLLLSSKIPADALVWDFVPVNVPFDWKLTNGLATIGTVLWATGSSGATRRATIFKIDLAGGSKAAYPLGPDFGANPVALSITEGPGGNAWFTGAQQISDGVHQGGAFIAEITAEGTITRFSAGLSPSAFDRNALGILAYDPPSGVLAWADLTTPPSIGIMTPQGQIRELPIPQPVSYPSAITDGRDGSFYFLDAGSSNIGKLTPDGKFTFVAQNFAPGAPGPPVIIAGADTKLYFTIPSQNKICSVAFPGAITTYSIPTPQSGISSLALGQDGNIYFGEQNSGKIGRLIPSTGAFAEFSLLSTEPVLQNLLLPSPSLTPGYGAILATAFGSPGLLRIRDAGDPCPQVQSRFIGSLLYTAGEGFGLELGVPPDTAVASGGWPPGLTLRTVGNGFGIGGPVQTPGVFSGEVVITDSAQCPVDRARFALTILPHPGEQCDQSIYEDELCLLATAASDQSSAFPQAEVGHSRFWLGLSAVDPRTGVIGIGHAIPQKDGFGYFSFPSFTSDATFPEVMVKMVDGRAISCCFWLFHTGLTDLQYTLTVFDTVTGNYKQYQNDRSDPGKLCGAADTQFFDGVTPGPASAPNVPVLLETDLPTAELRLNPELIPDDKSHPAAAASCLANDSTVCLLGNRFSATLTAHDPRSGNDGVGHAIPQKDGFGYFSLPTFTFDATFPEVFVKMVDGRVLNSSFWVFHSGLTDLEYTLTITDTTNGASQVYHNDRSDPGKLCGAADTSAFH